MQVKEKTGREGRQLIQLEDKEASRALAADKEGRSRSKANSR